MRPVNTEAAIENLRRFLTARGWYIAREGRRVDEYAAPEGLGLPEDFRLAAPRRADAPDVSRLLTNVSSTLAEIYSLTTDQVEPVIESADVVLSIRIANGLTRTGVIEFSRLSEILDNLRGLILHTSAFVAEEDPLADQVPEEAFEYLDTCRFLQTARGSFVASVQLPTEGIIRDATLLNPEPVRARSVIERMSGVLDFVSTSVLDGGDDVFSVEHIQRHLDVINVSVLEDVGHMFEEVGLSALDFSFLGLDSATMVAPGQLSERRLATLAEYVRFVRKHLRQDIAIDIQGRVVELRSRNPQGNRNYVLVQTQFENQQTFVALTLRNELYAIAVQAHRASRPVHVVGRARKMKTQLKVALLERFAQM